MHARQLMIGLVLTTLFGSEALPASHEETIFWTLLYMPACEDVDGFAARAKRPYEQWQKKYRQQIDRIDKTAMPNLAGAGSAHSEEFRVKCENLLASMLDELRPVDPRLVSPAGTWKVFNQALRSADDAALADCFPSATRAQNVARFSYMTPVQRNDFLKFYEKLKPTERGDADSHIAEIEGQNRMVFFVKTERGWVIAEF